MIRICLFITLLSLAATAIKAQDLPPIATDRPDQTECPFIVPKGYIQAENGFFYEKSSPNTQSMAYPSILWKYGVSDNFELRLITELVSEKALLQTQMGISPVTVGFKVKILEENGWLPKTSFIGHLTVPKWASKELSANYYAPSFRFTMQHTLSDRFALAYNLGAEWDGETPEPTFIYTLTTGFAVTKKLGAYLELYGFSPQNQQSDHRLDGGFTYLMNNNVMIDISGGLGLTTNAPKYFVSLGFSYRFNVTKK
jgi:Putative MetA-pathway of phenol degradation